MSQQTDNTNNYIRQQYKYTDNTNPLVGVDIERGVRSRYQHSRHRAGNTLLTAGSTLGDMGKPETNTVQTMDQRYVYGNQRGGNFRDSNYIVAGAAMTDNAESVITPPGVVGRHIIAGTTAGSTASDNGHVIADNSDIH